MPSQISTILLLALAGAALSKPTPSDFKLELATRDFSATQQNFQPGKCAGTMLLYGRGTAEGGNVGLLVGPAFAEAIAAKGVDLAVQGINYPADVPGYLAGGDKGGSQLMAKLTQDTLKACPDSKVVMSGYSQGGQLVHNAAKSLPADVMGKVAGAVIFGDPCKCFMMRGRCFGDS